MVCQLSDVADSLAKTMHRHMAREEAGKSAAHRTPLCTALLVVAAPAACCTMVQCISTLCPCMAACRINLLVAIWLLVPPCDDPPLPPCPADVLPVLMRSVCMAQQRHMVWRILRAMPLRLLERVMPWVAGARCALVCGRCAVRCVCVGSAGRRS